MLELVGLFFVIFMGLAILRVPVGYSMCSAALVCYALGGLRFTGVPSALMAGLDSFPLLAIPAFIFAGDLMAQGGISSAIVNFVYALLRGFRGCLGSVLVVTAMLFGSITGSSLATVSALGGIMIPEMDKGGYDRRYSSALLSCTGILGVLLPPSVPGVVYALATEQKVTSVWLSTMTAGLVLGVLFMLVNYCVFGRGQSKIASARTLVDMGREVAATLPRASVAFVMPVIIFGGVYSGIFTATEAGAVSAVYGLLAGWIIYPFLFSSFPASSLWETVRSASLNMASICILIATATIVGRMIAMGGVTASLTEFLLSATSSRVTFLIGVNFLLLLCAMFLETNTTILLFAPLLVPVAQAYGVDPVHFGAILLLNVEIGLITPPFAANIFVACRITGCRLDEVIKPLLPFYLACLPVLLLITFVPEFTMFFVHLIG